jgi:Mg2+/citrate symporter
MVSKIGKVDKLERFWLFETVWRLVIALVAMGALVEGKESIPLRLDFVIGLMLIWAVSYPVIRGKK